MTSTKNYLYACLTDYLHELEECEVMFYPSIDRLKKKRKCTEQCGIARIPFPKDYEIVQAPNFSIKINKEREKDE